MQNVNRVLVYRLGSIGDAVVSLPCFHLVRRRFPAADIALLTNHPVESRAAPMASIFGGTGLVDRFIDYPIRTRRIGELMRLRRSIRAFAPDVIVYLASRTDFVLVLRDWVFFCLAGIKAAVGFPFARDQRMPFPPAMPGEIWESEADRLARCIVELGSAETGRAESWDLRLVSSERAEAGRLIAGQTTAGPPNSLPPIGVAVGTKQQHKDWGDGKWKTVIAALADPRRGLVLIGGGADRARSEDIARLWPGPVVNLCGRTTPRVSAAACERLAVLLCVDSGPMHLAAAVGTRCIAIFSARNRPGQWSPYGKGHKVLYPGGAQAPEVEPEQVIGAARAFLASGPAALRTKL